jgi:hypothetical protein
MIRFPLNEIGIHLHGIVITLTIRGHRVGHYGAQGKLLTPLTKKQAKAVEKTHGGKVKKTTFPPPLQLLDELSNRTLHLLGKPDIFTC